MDGYILQFYFKGHSAAGDGRLLAQEAGDVDMPRVQERWKLASATA
jgi:hypothetical protein